MDIEIKYTTMIVKDMDESVGFYRDIMGFEVDSQYNPPPGGRITLMRGKGDAMVELIENSAYETGLYSVGMNVDDLPQTLDELRNRGVTVTMEPVRTLVGSMAFIADPNRVRIALIQHDK